MKPIRRKKMLAKTNLKPTTQWRLEREGLFPPRRKLTPGGICIWDEDEVDEWLRTRPLASEIYKLEKINKPESS